MDTILPFGEDPVPFTIPLKFSQIRIRLSDGTFVGFPCTNDFVEIGQHTVAGKAMLEKTVGEFVAVNHGHDRVTVMPEDVVE